MNFIRRYIENKFALSIVVIAILLAGVFCVWRLFFWSTPLSQKAAIQPTVSTLPPVVKYSGQSAANGQPLTTAGQAPSSSASTSTSGTAAATPAHSVSSSSADTAEPDTQVPPIKTVPPVTGSGISGHIYLGFAGCTPPRECVEPAIIKPYQATVQVETAGGAAVTSFTSAGDGNFTVVLQPGVYLLVPQYYDNGKITAPTQQITVAPNRYTTITIEYQQRS